jgi:hypothetical protein
MDDLKIEHGLNGVSFIHLNGKPVLSISRYGRHAQATPLLELLLAAPELLSSLKDITAAAQRAVETAKRGEPGAWVELEEPAAVALAQIAKWQPPGNEVEPNG